METDNYEKIFKDLEIYKGKIDAFIDYDVFNKTDINDDDEASHNSEKSKNDTSTEKKKLLLSSYEKYNRIVENLLSQIKVS